MLRFSYFRRQSTRMYRPVFVHVGPLPEDINVDIELPMGDLPSSAPSVSVTEYKVFQRPKGEALGRTLERIRLAFMPKLPPAPKAQKKSIKDSPSAKEALGKNQKEERLKVCPEAILLLPDESTPVDHDVPNVLAFAADNILQIGELRWRIMLNVPRIKHFSPPAVLIEGCPTVPNVTKSTCVVDPTKDVQWRWWIEDDIENALCTTMVCVPPSTAVGHRLTVQCCDGYNRSEVVKTPVVQRRMHSLPRRIHFPLQPNLSNDTTNNFRVVTYNILHDSYADSDYARTQLYPYCRPELLELHQRETRLAEELGRYNADIVCLQEVGGGSFQRFLLPLFQQLDFGGLYESKFKTINAAAARGNAEDDEEILTTKDGVAVFWNKGKFEYLEHVTIPLTMGFFGTAFGQTSQWSYIKQRILQFDSVVEALENVTTVAVLVRLRCRASGRNLVVANTHLFWHPKATHVRLLQGFMVADAVAHFRRVDGASVVLCGDLNNPPDGIVYELFQKGSVTSMHPDWKDSEVFRWEAPKSVSPVALPIFQMDLRLPEDLRLADTCGDWDLSVHTNVTTNFSARLDYIFVSVDSLQVRDVLPNPPIEELCAHTALPSDLFPSDHVAIVADLTLMNSAQS